MRFLLLFAISLGAFAQTTVDALYFYDIRNEEVGDVDMFAISLHGVKPGELTPINAYFYKTGDRGIASCALSFYLEKDDEISEFQVRVQKNESPICQRIYLLIPANGTMVKTWYGIVMKDERGSIFLERR